MMLRLLFNLLPGLALGAGGGLLLAGSRAAPPALRAALLLAGGGLAALGLVMLWWYLRPNRARLNPALAIESWDVVADGLHHSNTDLIRWDGAFLLVHAVAPFHFGTAGSQLRLLRSADGRGWEALASLASPGEDIRDPKLAVIRGRLFLYALVNRSFDPEPYTTVWARSDDGGRSWTPFQRLEPHGWLLWKPKPLGRARWLAGAYWHEHGRSALFSTTDGVHWQKMAEIFAAGRRNDETDIEALPDGKLLAVARLEGDFKTGGLGMFFGHPRGGTLIAMAQPPFTPFHELAISDRTRLDGPALFSHGGRVFAAGRFQPRRQPPFWHQGSIFARKRTSLFEVRPEGLTWLTDLPSAGDTSYVGVALHGGYAYLSYYTSPIQCDYPWIVGMFNRTAIRMARINLATLTQAAASLDG